ncbi:PSB2 [Enterospora canceri]|uniref:PSB2 n=1 Tax=Enterospora canceri TaxID=1081671 RepID=A0A1Y1S805_9MICR|nr:PSB2 [Enterospora canceri]
MISFAFVTSGKAYLISQTTLTNSIMRIKDSKEEVVEVNGTRAFISGNQGETYRLRMELQEGVEYVRRVFKKEMNTRNIANLFKNTIYDKIRTRMPYQVSGVFVGHDETGAMRLFHVDNYSAVNETHFVATNYGIYFLYGLADVFHKAEMEHEEAIEFINHALKALKERTAIDTRSWRLDVVKESLKVETQYIEI